MKFWVGLTFLMNVRINYAFLVLFVVHDFSVAVTFCPGFSKSQVGLTFSMYVHRNYVFMVLFVVLEYFYDCPGFSKFGLA